eukprot:TRINITY_DN12528_c0_g1_i7.p1 TRINITY_DN12528_c0_g1~~TRINITY_DN12528_c0_g1_i7.p1  ORF type:complete len:260 (+),score=58.82 TRINITY_DN12528_c0_g1_i7:125-904(+)
MEKRGYTMKFVKYEIEQGYVEYSVNVVSKDRRENFTIKDRYSSMRNYWKRLTSNFRKRVPSNFPAKKWFGNKNPLFIQRRMEELESYFNHLFTDSKLNDSLITKTYFEEKKVETKARKLREELKIHTIKIPEETRDKELTTANSSSQNSVERNLRNIAVLTTNSYMDVAFGEDPVLPEIVKARTQLYANSINQMLTYVSRALKTPKGGKGSLSLDLVRGEEELAEWLSGKVKEMIRSVEDKEGEYGKSGEILIYFDYYS